MNELEFNYTLLKKSEEDKLTQKFSTSFQYFNELMKYADSTKEITDDISKETKAKADSFLKNISNIFVQIFVDIQRSHDKMAEFAKELLKMGKILYF